MKKKILGLGKILFLSLIFSGLIFQSYPQSAQAQTILQPAPTGNVEYVPGQILVRFSSGVSEGRANQILQERGTQKLREVPALDVRVVELPAQLDVDRAVEIFNRHPEVEFAEPNYLLRIAQSTDDWQDNQWAPQKIQAPEAWTQITDPNPVTIAIVDTGVDYRHSQLQPNMHVNSAEQTGLPGIDDDQNGFIDDVYGYDFYNNDGDPLDDHAHGTHVGGIAAATTGSTAESMTGICPFCEVMAVKVLGAEGSGALDVVANGITYAADNGAKVISLSLGAPLGLATLQEAVDYAWNQGSLVVAAAGNNGGDVRVYPGAYANAVAVASTTDVDYRSCFSNYGNFADPFVDVSAPGEAIYSTTPLDTTGSDTYATYSGTSMATPHVSGVAGLLFAQDANANNAAVRERIEATSVDLGPSGADPFFGTGRVNALRAVLDDRSTTTPPDGLFTTSLTSTGYAHARKLARDANGVVHLIWHTQEGDVFRIRYATSTDDGVNWTFQSDVYSGALETYHPALAIDDRSVYVAYPQKSTTDPNAMYQIRFVRKSLTGGGWSSAESLMGGSFNAVRPDLYVDRTNGRLHLAASSLDDARHVYYRASGDRGASWSPLVSVDPSTSTTVSNTRYATVHANGDNVYIAARTVATSFLYTYYYLHTVRSTDGGTTWFDQTKISSYTALFSGEYGVSLAGIADRLFMGYEVGGNLYFRRYDETGWSDFLQLESSGAWPSITQAQNGEGWLLWEVEGSLLTRHYDGSTWEPAQSLLAASGLNKGYYPNLKLGTSGGKVEWVYTSCTGAPFSIVYGSAAVDEPTPSSPSAPTNLSATPQSSSEIHLNWTDNAGNEDGFEVERSPDGISGWTLVATLGANNTSYQDTGLTSGMTYYYRVRAFNIAGHSSYSNVASAATPSAPLAPSNLTASAVSASQIDLSWNDNSTNEEGFEVERSPDGITGWTQITILGANTSSHSDAGLNADTSYYYRVRAFNTTGNSTYSNIADAATFSPPVINESTANGELTVAGLVSGSYLDTYANEGNLESISEIESGGRPSRRYSYLEHRWTFDVQPGDLATFQANVWASPSPDGDSFVFEYSTDEINYTPMFTVASTGDDDAYLVYTFSNPPTGTVYVRVVDTDRTEGFRNLDTVHVDHLFIRTESTGGNPPAAPTNLAAQTISDSQIELTWTDNSSDEAGFRIERSLNSITWQEIATAGIGTTNHTDEGLQANTTYHYRVIAFNAAGNSTPSNTASATTDPAPENSTHIGDLDGSSSPGRSGRWDATITITVHDDGHNGVSGATVSGVWIEGLSGSCVTDGTGSCSITKTSIKNNVPSVTFSVTGISHTTLIYEPAGNHDPEGDSDGTTITVLQP